MSALALVAEEAVEIAVKIVGSAFGDEVDVATDSAAEFGLAAAGDDLHLADDAQAERGC